MYNKHLGAVIGFANVSTTTAHLVHCEKPLERGYSTRAVSVQWSASICIAQNMQCYCLLRTSQCSQQDFVKQSVFVSSSHKHTEAVA